MAEGRGNRKNSKRFCGPNGWAMSEVKHRRWPRVAPGVLALISWISGIKMELLLTFLSHGTRITSISNRYRQGRVPVLFARRSRYSARATILKRCCFLRYIILTHSCRNLDRAYRRVGHRYDIVFELRRRDSRDVWSIDVYWRGARQVRYRAD